MANLNYALLEDDELAGALQRYIEHKIPPGPWLYNEAPSNCWGSPEHFRAWLTGSKIDG